MPGESAAGKEIVELPFLQRRGATVLGAFNTWIGTRLPQLSTLLACPDEAVRWAALRDLDADPAIAGLRAAERRGLGHPLFTSGEAYTQAGVYASTQIHGHRFSIRDGERLPPS